jgi:hypothetical protein
MSKQWLFAQLLSITILTGCVWMSNFAQPQARNRQLQEQPAAPQRQVSRLQGAIKHVANSCSRQEAGGCASRDSKLVLNVRKSVLML